MARTETVLSIFLAAPGDVSEECGRLDRIVTDLNSSMARRTGVRLELMRWNRDASPTIANSPQDGINSQIPEYDILIGILWHTIGTPTKNHASGTVEEYELAKARHAKNSESVEIMFYFKTSPPRSLKDLDTKQYQGVLDFKERIGKEGVLYAEFQSIDQFSSKIQMDLSKYMLDRRAPDAEVQAFGAPGFRRIAIVDEDGDQNESMEIYDTVDNDSEDEGFIELYEEFQNASEELGEVVNEMADAIVDIGNCAREEAERISEYKRTVDVENLDSRGKADFVRKFKSSANKIADDMHGFTARMNPQLPLYRRHLDGMIGNFARMAPYYVEFGEEEEDVKKALKDFLSSTANMIDGIEGFREQIQGIPKLTTRFGRARRDTERTLREVVEVSKDAKVTLERALLLLQSDDGKQTEKQ